MFSAFSIHLLLYNNLVSWVKKAEEMKEMSPDEFITLIEARHETHNIEWKDPFLWNDESRLFLQEKTIQTILGMSNKVGQYASTQHRRILNSHSRPFIGRSNYADR